MFWIATAVVVVVVLLLLLRWLNQPVKREAQISLVSTARREDFFDFLSTPSNLERTHPHSLKITAVDQQEERTRFEFEEHLSVLGKKKVTMEMWAYRHVSQFTSLVRLENNSPEATVHLTFSITDYDHEGHPDTPPDPAPACTVRQVIMVDASRWLCFIVVGHVTRVWRTTLRNTAALLETGQPDAGR